MANVTSAQDGDWNTASTWDTGTVPTAADYVFIKHAVKFKLSITADMIFIEKGGSLYLEDSTMAYTASIKVTCNRIRMYRELHDTRRINMDGVEIDVAQPSLTCDAEANITDGFARTESLYENAARDIIIDDPGFISSSARLRDILPEGCAPAYVEKISNAVRYITATLHIKASKQYYLIYLYRMARFPFQALLVTRTCVLKGFIENVTPDPGSVGKEYITVKVTIAEGPGA